VGFIYVSTGSTNRVDQTWFYKLKMANRKLIWLLILITHTVYSQELHDKALFENSLMDKSYFHTQVEYSGASWVKNIQGKLPVSDAIFFTPGNALELQFVSSPKGKWTAAVQYHQLRGIDDFKDADQLSFWLFARQGNQQSLPLVSLNLGNRHSEKIKLDNYITDFKADTWTQVRIPLVAFSKSGVRSVEVQGIEFSQNGMLSSEGHLYLDQIEILPAAFIAIVLDKPPVLLSTKGYEQHIDITWKKEVNTLIKYIKIYRSFDGKDFNAVGIQPPTISGYSDFIGLRDGVIHYKLTYLDQQYNETGFSNVLSASVKAMSDDELLDMVQQSHFRYYWDGAEPNSGLALENIPGRSHMIATGASGFGIMAIISAAHRGFITREQAVERFVKITDFLLKADRFHGVFPHFLDGETGKTVPFFGNRDNGGDLVETSFLMQGLLAARQYFTRKDARETSIRNAITKLWDEVEWDWYRRTKDSDFLYWHWSPDQAWVIDHRLIGWNETMITYFLAIASKTHPIPPSMYYTGWASQSAIAAKYRADWGQTTDGATYTNGNTYYGIELPVGVSNGGPLFFVHYSFLGLNPHQFTDKYVNYFENNKRIAEINLRYCIENPNKHKGYGEDFWGLTASDGTDNYSADEPTVRGDKGKLTATGALASFPYTPEASMKALRNYYRNYGQYLYGYYGFRDAIDLDKNWCSPIYMGLNQAPVVVMIENYRSKLLWDLFMANTEVQQGVEKLNVLKAVNKK
jgi:hypothetical protein